MIPLTFRELRVVELVEAYRTDLSMVVSGAVDTDYYLWSPRGRTACVHARSVATWRLLWQGEPMVDAPRSAADPPLRRSNRR